MTKKSHVLGIQNENHTMPKKNGVFSDDFGLRSPAFQKTFQTKSAAPIVARVLPWDVTLKVGNTEKNAQAYFFKTSFSRTNARFFKDKTPLYANGNVGTSLFARYQPWFGRKIILGIVLKPPNVTSQS